MGQVFRRQNGEASYSNPYASPLHVGDETDQARSLAHVQSVARVFKMLGWFGALLYLPIVVGTFLFLIGSLLGLVQAPTGILLIALPFHGSVFAVSVLYVFTGKRIARRDATVKPIATVLCCLMMIGFPIFTIAGFICLRKLRRYL